MNIPKPNIDHPMRIPLNQPFGDDMTALEISDDKIIRPKYSTDMLCSWSYKKLTWPKRNGKTHLSVSTLFACDK